VKPELTGLSVEYLRERGQVTMVEVIPHQKGAMTDLADRLQPIGRVVMTAVATFEMGEERVQVGQLMIFVAYATRPPPGDDQGQLGCSCRDPLWV
jgi:hypothetical protein